MKRSTITLIICFCLGLFILQSCKKPQGCMDPKACNYDPEAKKDDGSCNSPTIWYADIDGDGLGNLADTVSACTQPVGYVNNSDDQMDALVERKSMSLISKITATWCGPCGSWGWTLLEDIIAETSGEAVIMSVYSPTNSELNNTTAVDFGDDFGTQGYPSFCVNGKNRTEYSTTGGIFTDQTKTNVIATSDSMAASNALVSMAYQKSIDGTTLTLNTLTEFYANLTGEYYLGAYVIEDGVIEDQAGDAGAGAAHHFVLRGSVDGNTYGALLNSAGSVTANETIEKSFTMDLDASWVTDNISIALVVWRKSNGEYFFMNAYTNASGH